MKKWVLAMSVWVVGFQLHAQCLSGDCRFGYGKKKYKSGAIYYGQFQNGLLHGKGKVVYSNGSSYHGTWQRNKRHGKGDMNYRNGDFYKGDFYKDRLHGNGRIQFANGERYEGQFANDQKSGFGVYSYYNGNIYKGNFLKDLRHGKGTMTYKGGGSYVGDWKNDTKNGHGIYTDADGNVYDGNWKDGEFVTPNHTQPSNTLDEFNTPNTSTTSTSSNNSNTNHTSSSTTVASSQGTNLKDCNTGYCHNIKGIYVYAKGSKYVGDFKNGVPEGKGTIHYINGDVYTGGWKSDAPHGEGVMTYKDGRNLVALWNYGRPIKALDNINPEVNVAVEQSEEVKVWAVIVGVGRYNHMQTLKYTDDDAYKMYAFLKSPEGGAIPDEQIAVLIDEDATRSQILLKMKQVFLKADANDVVMLYYSGHGLEGSFVPFDYNGMNNLLQHSEVTSILKRSRAKHKIVLADACHAGSMLAMKGRSSASATQATIDKYYSAFSSSNGGTALLLSSKSEETSLEDSGLRQGVFSHFVMKGMKGEADTNRNKIVTITELFQYVHKKVTNYTANAQTPNLTGKFDANMPVAVIK